MSAETDASETTEAIMAATYDALCECGYADLTTREIADRSPVSTAALHYHYDSKRDLLSAFLDHLYEEWEAEVAGAEDRADDPAARLHALIDAVLAVDDDVDEPLQTAILEIKAQAPYDERFRERLRRFDERFHEAVRTTIAAGVADGTFRAVDPGAEATFLTSAVSGAHVRKASLGADVAEIRGRLREYVDERLRGDRE
jgi:TetR/AcrR family transcriptional repressor of nem operon